VDVEVDSLNVKRIAIEDLVSYVYIVKVDLVTELSYCWKPYYGPWLITELSCCCK
jgi:hypothetical protein